MGKKSRKSKKNKKSKKGQKPVEERIVGPGSRKPRGDKKIGPTPSRKKKQFDFPLFKLRLESMDCNACRLLPLSAIDK